LPTAGKNARQWGGGTLTTAGNLVFQGQPDGLFKAYDARTGDELWSYDVGLGISAPPITYKLDGKQMVSLLVGPGGALASNFGGSGELGFESHGWKYGAHERRIMTFSLDGKAVVPKQPAPQLATPIIDEKFKVDAKESGGRRGRFCGKPLCRLSWRRSGCRYEGTRSTGVADLAHRQ